MKLTTARLTGLFYLGLAVTGVFTFLFARDQIYIAGDASATTANLINQEALSRFGIAAEIALVGFQALAAVWFFQLFRSKNAFAAGLIAAFGLVNAIIILVASAMWLSAHNLALSGGDAASVFLLFILHENLWVVGKLFFGLWLLPIAYLTKISSLPRFLGWFLALGGIGYVLSTFTSVLLPQQTTLTEALPLAATIGEFWLIGYLLVKPVKV